MPLFTGKTASQAVTAADIKQYTGIKADDFSFTGEGAETQLETLLNQWTERIASHILARLKRSIADTADEYEAIRDILIRTVAKLVATAQQQRTSPIVRLGEFAVGIIDTSAVTKDLDAELKQFRSSSTIKIISSADEWVEPS
jgi:hypothetical protein